MSYDPNQENNPEQPVNPAPPPAAPYPPVAPYSSSNPYPPSAPYPPYQSDRPGYEAPPVQPLPLGEAIRQLPGQYLRAVTRPGPKFFAAEEGKAAWNIIWVQLIFLSIITAIFVALLFALTLPATLSAFNLSSTSTGANVTSQAAQLYRSLALPAGIGALFLTPISQFIGVGIYFLIAKLFKGQGTFVRYFYSYLLFSVPLTIITALISLIPFVGSYLAWIFSIYQIVLLIFMTMAVHRMSGGRATLAVLLLPIILFVLTIIGIFVFIAVIVSAIHPR